MAVEQEESMIHLALVDLLLPYLDLLPYRELAAKTWLHRQAMAPAAMVSRQALPLLALLLIGKAVAVAAQAKQA